MSLSSLQADLKASLLDTAGYFTTTSDSNPGDADFQRHLGNAAEDLSRIAPSYNEGSITLVADQDLYAAPSDYKAFRRLIWGENARRCDPWERGYVPARMLPKVSTINDTGAPMLQLSPAPSTQLIMLLGVNCPFTYLIQFTISATASLTTVPLYRRALLLLRAQAEAMKELAQRGIAKPVQLRDGMTQAPKNASPAALYDQFMTMCERQAA